MAITFGWCSDEYHESCSVHFRDRYEPEKIHECACKCHEGKKKPPPPEPHEPPKEDKVRRRKTKKT